MSGLLRSLSLSLGLTLLLELGAALVLGFRKKQDLGLIFLVNVFTNPLVVLSLNLAALFLKTPPPWYLVGFLEIFAVSAEWLLYRNRLRFTRFSPFLLSLILNSISYLGGYLLS